MTFGLSLENFEFIRQQLQKVLPKHVKVWCFGSRARGNHREFSDLDLMVESDSDLTREIAQLKEIFEESRLPIKVDIVDLGSFANSYRDGFERDKLIFLNPS